VEGGRGLRVRVLGFPVHIDLSFVVTIGLIGWLSAARTPLDFVLWLVIATLAILIHELGHAVVARTTGARPEIALTGFGGVTVYAPPRPLSRGRSLAISVAGPLVGLAAGGLIWLAWITVGAGLAPGSAGWTALSYARFTTIGWSVLNLLPVLPLDGGQAMRELLPGTPPVRARRAAIGSLVALVPLFVLALWFRQPFLAVFLFLFGMSNLQVVRAGRDQARPAGGGAVGRSGPGGPYEPAELAPERAIVALLWQGQVAQARQALEARPPGTPVDPAVHGVVMATTGQPEQGLALLHQELARRPADGNVVALLVLTHLLLHDWDAVAADLVSGYARLVPLGVVERALQEAEAAGRPDVVARLSALPWPESR
jgi:Zn-dependent protease